MLFYFFSENVAVGKVAFQSSTRWGGAASRAVDGHAYTLYMWNSCTHTAPDAQPWWAVDLVNSMQVQRVEITNRFVHGKYMSYRQLGFELPHYFMILITGIDNV